MTQPPAIALLVIDFSVAFTDPTSPVACDADAALGATADLLEAARKGGALVVFTTVAYDATSRLRAHRFIDKNPVLLALQTGTPAVEIDERVAPHRGEAVLTKLFASGFFDTALAETLTDAGIESVMVVGASTSGCVRATVVDAIQHGFCAYVPKDAVADRSSAAHEQSLTDIQSRYGEVIDLPEALALFRPAEHAATKPARQDSQKLSAGAPQ